MRERFGRAYNKIKTKLIIAMILLVIISLLFIAPLSVAITNTLEKGAFDLAVFASEVGDSLSNLFSSIGKAFTKEYIGMYWSILWKFMLAYVIAITIGFTKSFPKGDYGDIEHGSGDWSAGGEQYASLSSKEGIILAEKNYLPIDKRGNVNVLVVGRLRIW